jgi:hypothetical protein
MKPNWNLQKTRYYRRNSTKQARNWEKEQKQDVRIQNSQNKLKKKKQKKPQTENN